MSKKDNKKTFKTALELSKINGRDAVQLSKELRLVDLFEDGLLGKAYKGLSGVIPYMPVTPSTPEGKMFWQPSSVAPEQYQMTVKHYAANSTPIPDTDVGQIDETDIVNRLRHRVISRSLWGIYPTNQQEAPADSEFTDLPTSFEVTGSSNNGLTLNTLPTWLAELGFNVVINDAVPKNKLVMVGQDGSGTVIDLGITPIAHDDIMLDDGVPEVQASATDIEL